MSFEFQEGLEYFLSIVPDNNRWSFIHANVNDFWVTHGSYMYYPNNGSASTVGAFEDQLRGHIPDNGAIPGVNVNMQAAIDAANKINAEAAADIAWEIEQANLFAEMAGSQTVTTAEGSKTKLLGVAQEAITALPDKINLIISDANAKVNAIGDTVTNTGMPEDNKSVVSRGITGLIIVVIMIIFVVSWIARRKR